MEKLLKLNLQFFSEDEPTGAEDVNDPKDSDKDIEPKEKSYTQEDIDRIITERLARDRKAREDEAERKRLEEEGKYKELLEKANQTIVELESEKTAIKRSQTIKEALSAKGLNHEEVEKYSVYVDKLADNDESIAQTVESVYSDFVAAKQAAFVEPSAGFGTPKTTQQKSEADYGAELYKRLRG